MTLEQVSDRAVATGQDPKPVSGRQEYLENLLNRFV
jgi:xylose isomerase